MNQHVTKWYVDWSEKRLGTGRMARVEQHLQSCEACRRYFDKMDALFAPVDPAALPQLQPDPYLPIRIRALAGQRAAEGRAGQQAGVILPNKVQLGLSGIMLMAAISIGVYLGKGLATYQTVTSPPDSESDLVSQYYDAFSYDGFAESWETVVGSETSGNNRDEATP